MILQLFMLIGASSALDIQQIVFVILSQENKYHSNLAENLRKDITSQSQALFGEIPTVHLSHADFASHATWAILPIIPDLANLHENNASWIFFLQDYTKVKLYKLSNTFKKYNPDEEIWFGNGLHDRQPTIIHHFAFFPRIFQYPNLASGFAMSLPLLNRIAKHLKGNTIEVSNFSVDVAHELAKFIWNDGNGILMKNESTLCSKMQPHCATFPIPSRFCDTQVPIRSIYFAVKTCRKFHHDRLTVVKNTWGEHTHFISFFSDLEDPYIQTMDLGIPNTENGHCAKTLAILKYVAERIKIGGEGIRWIVIADDDTILGTSSLQRLLACYDDTEKVALGERYGYNVRELSGYNYLTGGGGMVFSRPLVTHLVAKCRCPAPDAPDDMVLGACMTASGVPVTHVPGFHQARPNDYTYEYLETHEAVSFHRHWNNNPIEIYEKWFESSDERKYERSVRNEL